MIPVLTYKGVELIPYEIIEDNTSITLHYEYNTPIPANTDTWSRQLSEQGYDLTGYGRTAYPVHYKREKPHMYVRALKAQR